MVVKKISLKNQLSELNILVDLVYEFGNEAHLSSETIFDIRLATEEVFANVVSHGYKSPGDQLIHITFENSGDDMSIIIIDSGKPFDIEKVEKPDINLPMEKRKIGGLGLFLIYELMDEVIYNSTAGKNTMVFKKQLKSHNH
ncbi:MAG: ATP-binding protein [Candidatus Marinimicrobia bacterium]|jgi:serine/threonine-protein kinase RsbW|nr:ATP-binding protein [Candidatus Neomarinimicrobiota bacterium]MBT3633545.1 ATP-binding protein [Candidatus Neomarinimicrobiota bacterium]MBT3681687.1 ATP-binding protein [Candidatus Neomarinimicrobiota bacterium]MBT3758345.1 ATP-binding protein [Candidatus Neomarinimicrobiota bacterium]MBT3895001.1 ATP-binding protein [Candidatus Neomarinimicrobiota bacterium]